MRLFFNKMVHQFFLLAAFAFAGTVILIGTLVMMFIVLSVFRPDDIEFFKSLF